MELAKVFVDGVTLAGRELALEQLSLVVKTVVMDVQGSTAVATIEDAVTSVPDGIDALKYKQAYSGIVALLLEAARHDVASSELTSYLEDLNWPASHISAFSTSFETARNTLRTRVLPPLSNARIGLGSLVDLHYRLDLSLRSHLIDEVHAPTYIVTLVTATSHPRTGERQLHQHTFSASLQQLQDMLSKVKDATKHVKPTAGDD